MSKFQPAYNQAKKKIQRVEIPAIDDEIRELKDTRRGLTNNDMKKAVDAKIKALEIKKKSFRSGDPVKEANVDEEAAGAITTGSIGSPNMSTNDGGTAPAVYGSSYIAVKDPGMVSRKGDIKPSGKKKKKKTQKEFVEYYFEINE